MYIRVCLLYEVTPAWVKGKTTKARWRHNVSYCVKFTPTYKVQEYLQKLISTCIGDFWSVFNKNEDDALIYLREKKKNPKIDKYPSGGL